MTYRLIDHTADMGIRVFGNDREDLFVNAARALFDLITDVNVLNPQKEIRIRVTGEDWPDLMVNWLRELLYLWAGEEKLVSRVEILSLAEFELSAAVTVDSYRPERHIIKHEIKAVTYHQIEVKPGPNGWEATVIFDT